MNRIIFLIFLWSILISTPACLRLVSPTTIISEAKISSVALTGKSTIADYACMKYQVALGWEPNQTIIGAPDSTLLLTSSSATGKFFASKADCIAALSTNQISVPAGSSTINFYFLDTVAETVAITGTIQEKFSMSASVVVNQLRVLGQPDGVTSSAGVTSVKMDAPKNISIDDDHLAVSDSGNERVLLWSAWPTTNGQAADIVLGQPDFTSKVPSNGGVSARSMDLDWSPAVALDGTHVVVGDNNNNRALVWNSFPTSNFQNADIVLGQPNFTANAAVAAGGGVGVPTNHTASDVNAGGLSAVITNGKLAMLRAWKLLIWNTFPTANNQPADAQFGEPNPAHAWDYEWDNDSGGNNGCCSPSGQTMRFAFGLGSNGTDFFIGDSYNNRVLTFPAHPTMSDTASVVLGHANMTTYTWFDTALSASNFYAPYGVAAAGRWVAVADQNRNRVLIWKTLPTVNNQAADVVFGQPNFISNTANNPSISTSTLSLPFGMTTDGTRLFIVDSANNRVLVVPMAPLIN